MLKDQLVGSWRLVSFVYRTVEGKLIYPMGQNPAGLLIYDSAGNFSTQLMNGDRAKFASDDRTKASSEEIAAAFAGYMAYWGRYEVDEEKGCLSYTSTGSLFPNWIGKTQMRYVALEQGRLRLTTPPFVTAGQEVTSEMILEKISG